MNRLVIFALLPMLAPASWAQADDLAEERARLANQRIVAEARAREEQEREANSAAAVEMQNAAPLAPSSENASTGAAPRAAARSPEDVDRLLEQIRTLGELRDAGYVTEAEFDRIKRRILDGAL